MRNPFRLRTAQRIVNDYNFVELFGANAINIFTDIENPWSDVLLIRGAPGGGKTTLLRMLTPRPLRLVCDNVYRTQIKRLYNELKKLEAIKNNSPNIFGVMLSFSSEYHDLESIDKANRSFKALVNSRIVVATIRSVLDWYKKSQSKDLESIHFSWIPEVSSTIPASANGKELFDWASDIEKNFYEQMDNLGNSTNYASMHSRLDALKWLANSKITCNGQELLVKRVLLFDEVQSLTKLQRKRILDVIFESRENCGVWIAERTEALTSFEILSKGVLKNRDYRTVINLEEVRSGKNSEKYQKFLNEIANLRVNKADGFTQRDFQSLIDNDDDRSDWRHGLHKKNKELVNDMMRSGYHKKSANWVESIMASELSLFDKAIKLKCLQILNSREKKKAQQTFDIPIPNSSFEESERTVKILAEHFLRKEMNAPMYFGFKSLSIISSANVDQFLDVTGEIFERIASKALQQEPESLDADEQHGIIRDVAESRWRELVHRVPNGGQTISLLKSLGKFCTEQTYQPNAPYANGVTGFALTIRERDKLIDNANPSQTGELCKIREVLSVLVANNMLMQIPVMQGGDHHIVFYMNRLLCAYFNLPLTYGGWRKKNLEHIYQWMFQEDT